MTLFVLIGWVFLSFVIAGAAYERGRSPFGWFLFSICFSPLIAGLFLLLFPPISSIDDQALQGSIRAADRLAMAVQELREAKPPPEKRGIRSLMVVIVVLMLTIALAALGVTNVREQHDAQSGSQRTATSAQPEADRNNSSGFATPKPLDYAVIAS
jgi:hypothetical protein